MIAKRGDKYFVESKDGEKILDGPFDSKEEAEKRLAEIEAIAHARKDADWDTAYVNGLPDSAFLYVAPGGKKDEDGRTVPRSLRHFPYRNASGEVDLPHLRNALARIPQSDVPASAKDEAEKKGRAALEGGSRTDCGVHRFDAGTVPLERARRLDNGWVEVDGILTRSGVFEYRNDDGSIRREYRPPEEVFHRDAMGSFSLVPVTDDHPDTVYPKDPAKNGTLTAANTRAYQRGTVAQPRREGTYLRGTLRVNDAQLVAKMDAGKTAVSCGYLCDLERTPGVTEDGVRYDAVQRNIRGNHVAVVDVGRAGPEARVRMDATSVPNFLTPADSAGTLVAMTPEEIKKLQEALAAATARADRLETALAAETTRANAAVGRADSLEVQKVELEKSRLDKSILEEMQVKLDSANAQLDAERAARKIAEDPQRLAVAVKARTRIETSARAILGERFRADLDDRDLMLAVVEKVQGPVENAKDRDASYVQARFDTAVAGWTAGERAIEAVKNEVRKDAKEVRVDSRTARQKMIEANRTLAPVSKE